MRQNSSGNYIADKAPGENLYYGFNFTDWLDSGELVSNSTWTTAAGLTLTNPAYSATVTKVYVSGGTVGTSYVLTNTVTTNSSPARISVRTITLTVKTR
jgi:hypothetical protein